MRTFTTNDRSGADDIVVAHSRPMDNYQASEAYSRFENGYFAEGLVPMVFLDSGLDTIEYRIKLQAEASAPVIARQSLRPND